MSRTSEAPASQEPLSSKRKMPWSLTFVLLAVCLVDGILTLVGQSRLYWANHIFENEFDPLFAWFLEVSPHLFVWALLALAALLVFAMRLLPLRFSLPVWLLFFVGHAASAASWIS